MYPMHKSSHMHQGIITLETEI